MKKFVVKALIGALDLFQNLVVDRFNSPWVKGATDVTVNRLKLFGLAIIDSDPNDKEQLEKIAKETLLSPEFQNFERTITRDLASQIPNQKLAQVLVSTDELRLAFFAIFGDTNSNNKEQLEDLFNSYVKSEEFDTVVILLTELLLDKYAKNEITKRFALELIKSLVNSDDNV